MKRAGQLNKTSLHIEHRVRWKDIWPWGSSPEDGVGQNIVPMQKHLATKLLRLFSWKRSWAKHYAREEKHLAFKLFPWKRSLAQCTFLSTRRIPAYIPECAPWVCKYRNRIVWKFEHTHIENRGLGWDSCLRTQALSHKSWSCGAHKCKQMHQVWTLDLWL